jgi:hypothetical protein
MSGTKFDHAIPDILQGLPRDTRGYPIPAGVWCDPKTGEYDFRILDQQVRLKALKEKKCTISGELLLPGEYWFIGGPASFSGRLFVDGPMRYEAAEFSMKTCPYLALAQSRHREAGMEDRFRPAGTSMEKSALLMLGMSKSYRLEKLEDFVYVRAGPWRAVSWWRDGLRLSKPRALELLAETAPEIDILQGARSE